MKSLGLVPGCLVQFALLSTVVSTSEPSTNNSINEGLKRNRLDSRELALTALAVAEPAVESISDSLEEIWARETAMAQVEIERALLRLVAASMPHPTAPAPTPVAAPVLVPVAVTTSAPTTCLQNQTPEQYLLNELLKITPVSLLTNPASAQGKAFNFILGDPLVRQNVCTYPTLAQRYGLATFYYSTNGSNWHNSSEWVTNATECQWFGVSCGDGVRATNLTMEANNVAGTLPDEISTLYELDRLGLYNNTITGTIPKGFSNLTVLDVLDLEQNHLSGSAFSDTILSLTTLRQLFQSSNNLTGMLSADIASRLKTLTDLWVADNDLMGSIPDVIGNLTNLKTLILYGNSLNGELPASLGSLSGITNLQLYGNMFDKGVPLSLYGLTELTVLRLDQNFLTGTVGTEIGQLSQLTDLRMNNNNIQGTLPDNLFRLSNLRFLTAGSNTITGSIPNLFDGLVKLEDIDLSVSFYSGRIPDTVFGCPALQRVYLSSNALTGEIPANYANASKLVDLFLDDNILNGTVPAIASGELPLLQEFLLQNNKITGTMPASVCALRAAGTLLHLISDCGGAAPEIKCSYPDCCNRCFESGNIVNKRRRLTSFQPDEAVRAQTVLHSREQQSWHQHLQVVDVSGDIGLQQR